MGRRELELGGRLFHPGDEGDTHANHAKIMSCLWFDDQEEEAAKDYTSIVPNSKIVALTLRRGWARDPQAAGSVMCV